MIKRDGKDTTVHKPLDKTIQILEDRFNESQRIAKIGSWELDLISNTLYWSDEVYRMFGLKPQQFGATYEAFLDNIHPDDRDFVNAAYTESLKTKQPYNIVHRLLLKDGTIKYVNEYCKTFFDDKDKAVRSIGTVQDITEQKKAEEELRWAKELTEEALNAQLDTFFLFEMNTGRAVLWNRAFRDISGYTDDEISGMSAPESYYGPKDLELAADYIKKILGGWVGTVQLELICKNGNKVPTEYRSSVINDNNGNPEYIISIGRDITERKKVEETLKESEEKFRLIYETSGDGVMTLEPPEWRFTSGNNKILEIFRVKDENEFLSLAPWDFSPEYQPDGKLSNVKAKEMIDIAMSEGENFFEWTHKRIRGEEFYATVLLNKVEFKDKVFLQARVNDITYRKKAEEALRESEEKLRTTIENINDIIIWRMDEKGIFTYLSPAVLNILGYEPDEMVETSGFSYFKPEDKLLLQEKMAARITGDRTPNEFEMVAKDGSLIPMEIISSAIKNENGDTVGFSGIARDISERKKAEEEILKLKDGLEVQVAEKTKELKEKVSDLQRFFDATVDRELRMKELSDENEKLKAELEKKT